MYGNSRWSILETCPMYRKLLNATLCTLSLVIHIMSLILFFLMWSFQDARLMCLEQSISKSPFKRCSKCRITPHHAMSINAPEHWWINCVLIAIDCSGYWCYNLHDVQLWSLYNEIYEGVRPRCTTNDFQLGHCYRRRGIALVGAQQPCLKNIVSSPDQLLCCSRVSIYI